MEVGNYKISKKTLMDKFFYYLLLIAPSKIKQ